MHSKTLAESTNVFTTNNAIDYTYLDVDGIMKEHDHSLHSFISQHIVFIADFSRRYTAVRHRCC